MNIRSYLSLIFLMLSLSLISQSSNAAIECGGQGQAACESKSAEFVRGVPTHDACRDGGFVDPINGGECWRCPEGFVRSWRPITDKGAACIKPRGGLAYEKATQIPTNGGNCPAGQFFDPREGGECWSCPEGYDRSLAEIDKFNACVKAAHETFAAATQRSALKTQCDAGQFSDPNGGCYSCPSGYNRTGYPVTSNKACSKAVSSDKSAVNHGRGTGIFGTDCGSGQFWDPNGSCYSCPSGYSRTTAPVTAGNACRRNYEDLKPANSHGKLITACPAGQFGDPNGKCYTCPTGYKRTGYAVTDSRACAKVVPEAVSRATQESRLCKAEDGEFVHFGQCWTCPTGYDRSIAPIDSDLACITNASEFTAAEFLEPWGCDASKGEFWDPLNKNGSKLGSCWKCPSQTERSTARVDSNQACISAEIRWVNDPYDEPGMFRLGRTNQFTKMAVNLFQSPESIASITDFMHRIWEGMEDKTGTADQYVKEQWRLIASNPAESPAFIAYVFTSMQQILLLPANERSADEKALLTAFEDYINDRRLYMAEQAMEAYDGWKTAYDWRAAQRSNLASLAGTESPPPDFLALTQGSLEGSSKSGASLIAIAAVNRALSHLSQSQLVNLGNAIWPYMGEGLRRQVIKQVSEKAARQAATTAAKASTTIMRSAGPQIIFAVFTIVTEIRMNQVIDIANARIKIQESIDYIKRNPVSLDDLTSSEEQYQMMLKYWSLATDTKYSPPSAVISAAKKAEKIARESGFAREYTAPESSESGVVLVGNSVTIDTGESSGTEKSPVGEIEIQKVESISWSKEADKVEDIFIDHAGNIFRKVIASSEPVIQVFDSGRKQWSDVAKGFSDIAGADDGKVWLMDSAGALYSGSVDGSDIKKIDGAASAITSSNSGDLWVVSDKLNNQGGDIWILSNKRWQKKAGVKAVAIANQNGYMWAVNKQGDILRSDTNDARSLLRSRMKKMPGKALDIASGRDGSIYVVGTDNQLYLWDDTGSQWVKKQTSPKAVRVAVEQAGDVWLIDEKGSLFRGSYR
ncbi:MAG: hypothetical protein GYB21_02985 [Oceanospirillales bacterium]|nr:hypothetical protein [Oceanospirillales bacterium]